MGPKMVQADQNCQPKVVPPTKDGLYACAAFLSIVEQEQMTLVRCSKLKEMHQKSFTHMRVSNLLPAVTIGVYFVQELRIVRLLFEGSVYSKKDGTYYSTFSAVRMGKQDHS